MTAHLAAIGDFPFSIIRFLICAIPSTFLPAVIEAIYRFCLSTPGPRLVMRVPPRTLVPDSLRLGASPAW